MMKIMIEIKENIFLAPYTIYKIGGPAQFFANVVSGREIEEGISFARDQHIPFFMLGAGSNVLVSDAGYQGLVLRCAGGEIRIDDKMICDAGVMMARAVLESARAGLTGLEWGIGIPGTIGGSIRGNAGCFGGEIKDVVERVEVFDTHENVTKFLRASQCNFSYRDSIFKRHPEWIILSASFRLARGNAEFSQRMIKKISRERTEKQAIGDKSCGCIFKNVSWSRKDIDKKKLLTRFPELAQFKSTEYLPASFLIDSSGLKGRRVGGVHISPRHANYFVNDAAARAEHVLMLVSLAKNIVRRKYGIQLEEEIQYVGF